MQRDLGPIPESCNSPDGLLIGRSPSGGGLLRYSGKAHMITFAPPGSGKFTNSLGPNLAVYPGSVLCVDPKGQCAVVSARARRALGHKVHILNPFGLFADELGTSASYNPLDWLLSEPEELIDNAMMLSDCLVVDSGLQSEDHWNEQAKTLILGLILHVCTSPEFQGRRNLVTVRELIQEDGDGFKDVLINMAENKAAAGTAAGIARQIAGTPTNERGSIVSSANRHLRFIASDSLQSVLRVSSFDVTRLKSEPMSVFLVIPAKYLGSHSRWLRMMVTVAMLGATREGERPPKHPVIWMLDELAQLGYLKAVAEGYALLRGYGYRIWGVFQDLPQLNDIYKERGKSMLSSSVVQGFNINCLDTARWFSDIAGSQMRGGFSPEGPTVNPIIREDEVRGLPQDTVLVKIPQEKLFTCRKLVSWKDSEFASRLDEDPYQ